MEKLREAQVKAKQEAKEIQRLKNEIAGSIALKELEANPTGSFAVAFLDLLHTGITKASQRALFD
jgi:threonine synthase